MLIALAANGYTAYLLSMIYFQPILMPCFALRELSVSVIPLECCSHF